jgi:hypothetical protein
MPDWRVQWQFEGLQQENTQGPGFKVGWTETWYESTSNSIETALDRARTANQFYLSRRLATLCNIYRCVYVRVSAADNPRVSKTASVISGSGHISSTSIAVGHQVGFAHVNTAILVDFMAPPTSVIDTQHHRKMLFRGLPADVLNGNLIDRGTTTWPAFTRLFDYLGAGPAPNVVGPVEPFYRLRVRNAIQLDQGITALLIDDGGRTISVSAPLGNLTAGVAVRIRGVGFPRGVNRIWTVRTSALAPPYDLGRSRVQLAGTWDGTGFARVVSYLYRPATQYLVLGVRAIKTGRPLRLTRGRRRAV